MNDESMIEANEINDTTESVEKETPKVDESVKENATPKQTVTNVQPPKPKFQPSASKPVESFKAPTIEETFIIKKIREDIQFYINSMRPGRSHYNTEGPSIQIKFYKTILSILRLEGRNFMVLFEELLGVVHQYRTTIFDERHAYRYFELMNLTTVERKNFERILHLLLTTCDPKTRNKAVKYVDLDQTLEGFKDSNLHQRVIDFYTS